MYQVNQGVMEKVCKDQYETGESRWVDEQLTVGDTRVDVYRGMFTRVGLTPRAPAVDPGGAVPPDAPHQPQTVRL